MEQYEARGQNFLLNAAVAFGDACTRPKLTPTCPFYEEVDAGPTCGEQCREIAESLGDKSRKIATHQLGGLVLTGREIPRSAAAGAEEFDANRLYIAERDLPVADQTTSALLLALRHHSINIVLNESHTDQSGIPLAIWAELDRRDFPTPRCAAAGLSLQLARAAVSRATLGRLTDIGLIGSGLGNELSESDPWPEFLSSIHGKIAPLLSDTHRPRSGNAGGHRLVLPAWLAELDSDRTLSATIASDDFLRVAFSPDFVFRLSQWFGRLFTDDHYRVFRASVPDQHLFLGLDPSPYSDDTGNWLWTRLTQTSLDGWPESSLVHEWDWQARDETRGFPRRILGERVIQPAVISNAVLERLSSSNAETPSQGFDPHQFVDHAIELLKSGDPQGAANIFTGVTELRPTDALVWNNLGFCQLAFDPAAALHSFGKSAMFSRDGIQIRVVNQVLALHLMGRDDDALVLAGEIPDLPQGQTETWLWNHTAPKNAGVPELVENVQFYFENLVTHIERRLCVRGIPETKVGVD
jgi:hypothetical protein